MDRNLIRVGGLWIHKTKENTQYLSGSWGPSLKILLFKNKNKRPDSNDPDYTMFLAPIEQQQQKEQPKNESEDF